MNLKISVALFAAILAALGLMAPASQPNPSEAARLNNIGVAYMNQQLFEKLKQFQQAAEADPSFAIARLNQGVAYLNLQKIDEAKAALEDALKKDPKNPNAWFSLGLLAMPWKTLVNRTVAQRCWLDPIANVWNLPWS